MSSQRGSLTLLGAAAFAAAFWITLRVVAAAPPPSPSLEPTASAEPLAPDATAARD